MTKEKLPISTILIAVAALVGWIMGSWFTLSEAESTYTRPHAEDGKASVATSPSERRAGADATPLAQMPAMGWWSVVKRAVAGFSGDRVMANAAAVTFYALLALFPALAALISIYGMFADPSHLVDQIQSMSYIIPGGGIDI